MLNGAYRVPATLVGAALAGVLLWVAAAHIDRQTTGGYWAAYGIVAAAGLAFGLLQLRGRGGHPRAMLLAFVPVLIVAGWVLVAMQPHIGYGRAHVLAWSGDIGIRRTVDSLGTWAGVLAFGIGLTLAAALEPMRRRTVQSAPVVDQAAADEPLTAERLEVAEHDATRETIAS